MNKKSIWSSASCAPDTRKNPELDWFSTSADEKYKARAICQAECPIRKECLQIALDYRELHGIWGGVDDYELRRAMSVDSNGDPVQRDRSPRCPYCLSKKLEISGQKSSAGYKTECMGCGLTWHMAKIPNKLKGSRAAAAGLTRLDIGA